MITLFAGPLDGVTIPETGHTIAVHQEDGTHWYGADGRYLGREPVSSMPSLWERTSRWWAPQ